MNEALHFASRTLIAGGTPGREVWYNQHRGLPWFLALMFLVLKTKGCIPDSGMRKLAAARIRVGLLP